MTSFDGTRLALRAWGDSDLPVVVLVHGLGLSTGSWGRVPELLAGGHRVFAYDLRGHSDSEDATGGDYSLAAHARDLAAVLHHVVGQGGRAVLVGNSLGGGIILAHARRSGDGRIAGVVFAGSGGSGVTFPGLPARRRPVQVQRLLRAAWLRALRGTALLGKRIRPLEGLANRIIRRAAFTPDDPQGAVDRVREDFLATRARALARTTLASVSHDGVELAPDLGVPVLVLHGDRDPEVPQQEIQRLMAALPQAELVSFPGAGHMLPLTHPDAVADHIARWIHLQHSGLGRSERT